MHWSLVTFTTNGVSRSYQMDSSPSVAKGRSNAGPLCEPPRVWLRQGIDKERHGGPRRESLASSPLSHIEANPAREEKLTRQPSDFARQGVMEPGNSDIPSLSCMSVLARMWSGSGSQCRRRMGPRAGEILVVFLFGQSSWFGAG